MKTNKKIIGLLFLSGWCAALVLLAPVEVKAQAKSNKAITAHIGKVGEGASEHKEARKIVYGDVDGDGAKDAVVQYTLEGAGGGNSWGQNLAVFLNKKGAYKLAANETVGGKLFRSFSVLKVVGKEIVGATETCPDGEPQGICKNPAKGQVKLVLVGAKLQEN